MPSNYSSRSARLWKNYSQNLLPRTAVKSAHPNLITHYHEIGLRLFISDDHCVQPIQWSYFWILHLCHRWGLLVFSWRCICSVPSSPDQIANSVSWTFRARCRTNTTVCSLRIFVLLSDDHSKYTIIPCTGDTESVIYYSSSTDCTGSSVSSSFATEGYNYTCDGMWLSVYGHEGLHFPFNPRDLAIVYMPLYTEQQLMVTLSLSIITMEAP